MMARTLSSRSLELRTLPVDDARITAFAASFGAGDDLGQFDYFLPRLLDAGAEALFVNHSGGFVLTARVLLRSAAWAVGLGKAWPRGLRGSLFVVLV